MQRRTATTSSPNQQQETRATSEEELHRLLAVNSGDGGDDEATPSPTNASTTPSSFWSSQTVTILVILSFVAGVLIANYSHVLTGFVAPMTDGEDMQEGLWKQQAQALEDFSQDGGTPGTTVQSSSSSSSSSSFDTKEEEEVHDPSDIDEPSQYDKSSSDGPNERPLEDRTTPDDEPPPLPPGLRPITDATKLRQVASYRTGEALMINVHATHHAGTSFCNAVGRSGGPLWTNPDHPQHAWQLAPSASCWFDTNETVPVNERTPYNDLRKASFKTTTPWRGAETDDYVRAIRPYFHMTCWEYDGVDTMARNLSLTNWEHPWLVSVAITREPLSRLLAGGGNLKRRYPGYDRQQLSREGWWDYASLARQTDNFFLRILEGTPRNTTGVQRYAKELQQAAKRKNPPRERALGVAGNSSTVPNQAKPRRKTKKNQKPKDTQTTTIIHNNGGVDPGNPDDTEFPPPPGGFKYAADALPDPSILKQAFNVHEAEYERAVEQLNRFTFVLDIACLDEGLVQLAKLLHLDHERVKATSQAYRDNHARKKQYQTKSAFKKLTIRERIVWEDVYEYLVEKNAWDIQLYEYSKTISLVDCAALKTETEDDNDKEEEDPGE